MNFKKKTITFYSTYCPSLSLDVDECEEATDMCAQTCQDTQGSYTCGCQPGYALDGDGLGCSGMSQTSKKRTNNKSMYNFWL